MMYTLIQLLLLGMKNQRAKGVAKISLDGGNFRVL